MNQGNPWRDALEEYLLECEQAKDIAGRSKSLSSYGVANRLRSILALAAESPEPGETDEFAAERTPGLSDALYALKCKVAKRVPGMLYAFNEMEAGEREYILAGWGETLDYISALQDELALPTTEKAESPEPGEEFDEQGWANHLALKFAHRRTGGSVYMDGRHNPLPSEHREAEMFVNDLLAAVRGLAHPTTEKVEHDPAFGEYHRTGPEPKKADPEQVKRTYPNATEKVEGE